MVSSIYYHRPAPHHSPLTKATKPSQSPHLQPTHRKWLCAQLVRFPGPWPPQLGFRCTVPRQISGDSVRRLLRLLAASPSSLPGPYFNLALFKIADCNEWVLCFVMLSVDLVPFVIPKQSIGVVVVSLVLLMILDLIEKKQSKGSPF